MKSKLIALITTVIYFIFASCSNSIQTDKAPQEKDSVIKKQPVIKSVNLGVIENHSGQMGGDKDFVEMNRLLDVDSIDVIELYWRSYHNVNGKIINCEVKYTKSDCALSICFKMDEKEHHFDKNITNDVLKKFINDSKIKGWDDIEKFLDVKNQIEIVTAETIPAAGTHGLDALHLLIKSSSKEYVKKLKLKITFMAAEYNENGLDGYVPLNPNGSIKVIELDKPLNSESNIVEYNEILEGDLSDYATTADKIEVEVLSAE